MNYAQVRKFDVTNGPGVRTTLFVSGCTHNCKGCFNKEQQNFNYGEKWTKETEDEFISYVKNKNIEGVSILGGEPLEQNKDDSLLNLLKRINAETKKEIWIWSGFSFEDIIKDSKKLDIIKEADVLIDGKYDETLRNLSLKYRGSENQKVINIKESLIADKIILKDI